MPQMDFGTLPLWANSLLFLAAAGAVWIAGTKITRYANTISERTGIGKAMIGLLLLGFVTSLPEVAVSVAAGVAGDTSLAVNNLLGGVAMQVVILAIADGIYGEDAISSIIAHPVVLLQAALGILLLVAVAAGIAIGEVGVFGVGAWTTTVFLLAAISVWMVKVYQWEPAWRANEAPLPERRDDRDSRPDAGGDAGVDPSPANADEGDAPSGDAASVGRIGLYATLTAVVILLAGFVLARTGDALAAQTGLGQSFVGAVLLAISTSLPEISTVVAAVRIRQYEMAFADIFGTNLFDLSLLFLVDAIDPVGYALDDVGPFSLFAALLGIALTIVYLIGLIERRNRAVLRMGIDSMAAVVLYLGGLFILYRLR